MIKEKKINKIQFQKSGAGNINARLNLPIRWIRDMMGVTEEDREVMISVTSDNKIIIEKYNKGE